VDRYQHTTFPSYLGIAGILKFTEVGLLTTLEVTHGVVVFGVCEELSSLPTNTVTGYGAPLGASQETSNTVFSTILLSFTQESNLSVGAGTDTRGERQNEKRKARAIHINAILDQNL